MVSRIEFREFIEKLGSDVAAKTFSVGVARSAATGKYAVGVLASDGVTMMLPPDAARVFANAAERALHIFPPEQTVGFDDLILMLRTCADKAEQHDDPGTLDKGTG